jgi:hypothetical protein
VPGVDGALVTFKLLPPAQRMQVPDERGFVSTVSAACSQLTPCEDKSGQEWLEGSAARQDGQKLQAVPLCTENYVRPGLAYTRSCFACTCCHKLQAALCGSSMWSCRC